MSMNINEVAIYLDVSPTYLEKLVEGGLVYAELCEQEVWNKFTFKGYKQVYVFDDDEFKLLDVYIWQIRPKLMRTYGIEEDGQVKYNRRLSNILKREVILF